MLSPDYYESCADDILRLYQQLEDDIISDVVRRITKTGKVTDTARHQIEQLQEAGLLYDDILNIIAQNTYATSQHVKALFEDAGIETVRFDNRIYRENGLTPVDIRQSPAMRRTLEAGYRKTLGDMKNLTLTTAETSQTAYINACNQAYMQITSGAFSYQEAIRQAVQKTAQTGAMVLYPSGHTERIDVAVRRAVLTGVGQTCREIGLMNAGECGCDLLEITAHSGARPDHAKWQGKIVSLSGRKGYLSKSDIGYGTGDGFGGWNCRHDWFPFFEGYSKRNYSAKDLEKLDERNIEYNGKLYNQYEISQIQRRYEREIRTAKREQVAFKVAVEETDDPELMQVMQDSLNYANSLVKKRQAKMRDFIRQTGQSRDYFREQNYPKENLKKDLTFFSGNGKIKPKKNTIKLKEINGEHSIEYDLMKVNPKHDENDLKYSSNCQKCVCTYEARRRGFDVTAKPIANENENMATLDLKKGFPSVFKGAEMITVSGITKKEVCKNIEKQMTEWGDGSRAIVAVHWKTNGRGHVFMAEQIDGKTKFVDPQSNETDVRYYFKNIKTSIFKNDYTLILRTDNLEFTENIKKCCEEVD